MYGPFLFPIIQRYTVREKKRHDNALSALFVGNAFHTDLGYCTMLKFCIDDKHLASVTCIYFFLLLSWEVNEKQRDGRKPNSEE